jgi:mono/diheme cytochrome c family protein
LRRHHQEVPVVTIRTTAHRMLAVPRGRIGVAGMLGVATLLACSAAGQAQQATPAEGRRIAERYCARCHVVAPGGGAGWTDAPAFVEIAQDPKVTRAWMRDFVTKLHMHMLNTDRSPAEADAITAYLLSLRRRR